MQTRLFYQKKAKNYEIFANKAGQIDHQANFTCLNNQDVIAAHVSDHKPIIHDNMLFWNIMMQGKIRNSRGKIGYNNGFGIVETNAQYINRLMKIAKVIAEIIFYHPDIEIMGFCEGPIDASHLEAFYQQLKNFPWMQRFFANTNENAMFHDVKMEGAPNWGLLMLADSTYNVMTEQQTFIADLGLADKLTNRFQLWKLTKQGEDKFFALLHAPFAGDEHVKEKTALSLYGRKYGDFVQTILNQYSDKEFILAADFNLNPYLIAEWQDRVLDKIENHNSILLTMEEKNNQFLTKAVTVDGVLLSHREKQKYYSLSYNPGLFSRLIREHGLAQTNVEALRA